MGRSFQPAAISEAKGSYLTHKNRRRPSEPKPTNPIGPPPKELDAEERKQWKKLVAQIPPGVMYESDKLAFSILVRLSTKFWSREPMMGVETQQMITLMGKFAMTPADRAKVVVEKPKESSLSAFIARKTTPPELSPPTIDA
jgi:hypothetical protein